MSENKNLSIDEILAEAERVLQRIDEKSKRAINEINAVEESEHSEEDEDVKTYTPKSAPIKLDEEEEDVKEFTFKLAERETVKAAPASSNMDATQPVAIKEKTQAVPALTHDEKTAVVPATEKTAVVPNTSRAKKRFFKNEEDFSAQPPKIIEKSATIKSKSRFDKTSDLQEIPTILAVEELDKTRVTLDESKFSRQSHESDYDTSAQIKMMGFDDEMGKVPVIDEDVAEELLKQRREDKVNKFRLFAQEEIESSDRSEAKKFMRDDYKKSDSRIDTLEQFFKKKTSIQLSLIFTAIFGIPLALITMLHGTSYLPSVFNTDVYYITVITLFSLIVICSYNVIIHGFNFRHGINFDFPIALSALLTLAHTICLYALPDFAMDRGEVYASAAVFGLFLSLIGKRDMITRIIENFEFLTDSNDKYTVEDIVNEVDAAIISRNLLVGEPLLKYSVKTEFPTSFLEISCADEPADRISKILGPIMICLNLVMFAASGLYLKDFYVAFNILIVGMIISCPIVSLYATNSALKDVSRSIAKKGALVCGFEGAHVAHNSNALVMEASNLFGSRSCDMHGFKTFNGAKIDDAILQTAAVIMKTNSPLSSVFDDVIVGKQSILPEVDGVIYEDKMGTSAWIYQKKILVGNRDLLIRHGVSVPKEEYEKKYARKGRKALYLAVAGKISAMFIVSYSADDKLKRSLKKLEKSGITILLKSADPYINEKSVMEIFDLPEGFVRVMTSSNARTFEKYKDAVVEKSPAYTVHNGSALGFISAIRGSEVLVNIESILSVLISFGSAIGFGVVALLTFLDGLSQLSVLNVLIFQSVWSIFVLLITKIRRSGL